MKLLILSLVLLLLNSCSKSDVNEKMSTLMTKNLNKYKSRLLNKKINSLNNVVPDSLIKNNEANIIYLYTGNDCSLCVDNGFKFILEIDSLFKKQKIQVVSSNARVNLDQMRNQYYHYIHKDENDLIRRDLKFVYTPILIMLDSVSSIKDLFFPYTFRQDEKEKNFIASINKYENKITGVTKMINKIIGLFLISAAFSKLFEEKVIYRDYILDFIIDIEYQTVLYALVICIEVILSFFLLLEIKGYRLLTNILFFTFIIYHIFGQILNFKSSCYCITFLELNHLQMIYLISAILIMFNHIQIKNIFKTITNRRSNMIS